MKQGLEKAPPPLHPATIYCSSLNFKTGLNRFTFLAGAAFFAAAAGRPRPFLAAAAPSSAGAALLAAAFLVDAAFLTKKAYRKCVLLRILNKFKIR